MRGPSPRQHFPLGSGDEEKSLDFQGRRRTYLVHMPAGADPSRAFPVVLVLHGGIVNAYFTAYNTGMSATADRGGFIAVYPNGTGRYEDRILTWNVGFAYALRNNVDDVGFLREVIARVVSEYGADLRRVYATGISNGGILCYRLASEASDIVAAVAPVAGASAGREKAGAPLVVFPQPAHPVSVMAFHGMQDRFIPYGGGPGAGLANAVYLPVRKSIAMWVRYNGCSHSPSTETSPNGNIVRETYAGGREGAEVILYTIRDGGHSWPGGRPLDGRPPGGPLAGPEAGEPRREMGFVGRRIRSRMAARIGAPTQEISANDLMWEFFQRHARN